VTDPAQLVVGALVLWAPGLAWTWALADDLDVPRFLFVSVIVALTFQPGAMYLGNVFLGIPITPMHTVLLALGLAMLGLGWALRPRLERTWA
jgi:hypothetical protein